jgi:hypothetical protein
MDIRTLLWYGNIVGEVVVLCRLLSLGLGRRYRCFAAYLAVSAMRDCYLISRPDPAMMAYRILWVNTDPVLLILLTAVVLEAYSQITGRYPGMAYGRTVLNVSLGIGALAALIPAFLEANGYKTFLFVFERIVASLLAVFLVCAGWVFFWVKVRLPGNTIRHVRILTLFCAVMAASYFALNLGVHTQTASIAVLGGDLLCFVLWTVLLTRKGEQVNLPPGDPDAADRALRRFEELFRLGREASR